MLIRDVCQERKCKTLSLPYTQRQCCCTFDNKVKPKWNFTFLSQKSSPSVYMFVTVYHEQAEENVNNKVTQLDRLENLISNLNSKRYECIAEVLLKLSNQTNYLCLTNYFTKLYLEKKTYSDCSSGYSVLWEIGCKKSYVIYFHVLWPSETRSQF